MAIILLILGAVLVITGAKGTLGLLSAQLSKDFSGSGSYLSWVLAIGVIGAIGYVPALKKPSDYLIVLIIVTFVLSEGGIWAQLQSLLSNGPTSDQAINSTSGAGSGSSTNPLSSITQDLGSFASLASLFG